MWDVKSAIKDLCSFGPEALDTIPLAIDTIIRTRFGPTSLSGLVRDLVNACGPTGATLALECELRCLSEATNFDTIDSITSSIDDVTDLGADPRAAMQPLLELSEKLQAARELKAWSFEPDETPDPTGIRAIIDAAAWEAAGKPDMKKADMATLEKLIVYKIDIIQHRIGKTIAKIGARDKGLTADGPGDKAGVSP